MSKKTNLKKNITFTLFFFIISAGIIFPIFFFSDDLVVITSPSMEPTLNVGDLIIKKNKNPTNIIANEYYGDILVLRGPQYFYYKGFHPLFWNNLPINTIIIHRAIDKKLINNTWFFLTKGDNNPFPDGAYNILNSSENHILIDINITYGIYVPETEVIGVVDFKIPFIGYINIYFIPIMVSIFGVIFLYLLLKCLNYRIKLEKVDPIKN